MQSKRERRGEERERMGVLAGAHVGGVIAELAVTSSSGEWKLDGASPHVKVSYKRTCR